MAGLKLVALGVVAGCVAIAHPVRAAEPVPAAASPTVTAPTTTPAPVTAVDPLQDLKTNDTGSDPFSNSRGLNDILQRAMTAPSKSMEEFRAEQRDSIDDATAQFRKLQLERLRQAQQATPGTPMPQAPAPVVQTPTVQP